MVKSYQLENPSNSRVFIDFKNKKEPVRFEYPFKQRGFKGVFRTMNPIWRRIGFIPNMILAFVIICINRTSKVEVSTATTSSQFDFIAISLSMSLMLIIMPLILTLIFLNNKRLLLTIPKLNKFINIGNLKKININKLDSKIYEVPIFDNVFLEYKTREDFSKYLNKIEVTEYDFYYQKKKFLSKKLKKEQNDSYWKVRFIFSKIPKKGELNIEFI